MSEKLQILKKGSTGFLVERLRFCRIPISVLKPKN